MPKKKSLHYEKLLDKWTKKHVDLQREIFSKHSNAFEWLTNNTKRFALSSVAGIFLLTSPIISQIPTSFSANALEAAQTIDKKTFLIYDLKNVLPNEVRPLTPEEEAKVSEVLIRNFNFQVAPELNGIRLNTSYGLIGQEQHLARYPGDNMQSHFDTQESANKYWDYGMAPGLGGFGYFASSASMTKEDSLKEQYYIAVQSFLAPGFKDHVREYIDFFKYRKMLVVNPQNGKAVVAVIGDAGPAEWTGKHLGGSPEVMSYLERFDGRQRGPVLYFFVDDPENKVPLGPISL